MKHLIMVLAILAGCFSCTDADKEDDGTIPGTGPGTEEGTGTGTNPPQQSVSLYYENHTSGGEFLVGADYNGIRIGEYYWMDSNMNHTEPHWLWWNTPIGEATLFPITQELLNKYMKQVRLNHTQFQIDIDQFDKYYGKYYESFTINYMNSYAKMYEGKERALTEWEQASVKDFRQLFGMCPFRDGNSEQKLSVLDIRFALSCKKGDNPMTEYAIAGECGTTYWFDHPAVTNKYKFNMMPGGARINRVAEGQTTPWHTELCGHSSVFQAITGDLYHLFYTVKWKAKDGYISIHDNLDTGIGSQFHWQNIRWCRRLTNEELGYKLFIKTANEKIKGSEEWNALEDENEIPLLRKIRTKEFSSNDFEIFALECTAPSYSDPKDAIELPNGYLRGFYVQYFITDPQREKSTIGGKNPTISNILTFAANIDDASLK